MSELRLSGLSIYPVKSLAGIHLQQSEVDRFGLRHDRRWMLVDAQGEFLSQRRLPRMVLIQQRITGDELILHGAGQAALHLPLRPGPAERIKVKVWQDICQAQRCGREADQWLSSFLGQTCRLVYMPDAVKRSVDPDYASAQDQTAFSDGFPLLLISEASLEDLNGRLESPLPMSRFRPNLVVKGCAPFAEDGWSHIRIGGLVFRLVKPCTRCVITTVNPLTAETGPEPLKTLATYRRQGNQVLFGQNLLHETTGPLKLGMQIEVLDPAHG